MAGLIIAPDTLLVDALGNPLRAEPEPACTFANEEHAALTREAIEAAARALLPPPPDPSEYRPRFAAMPLLPTMPFHIGVSMASYIAAIDSDSDAVANFIAGRLSRLLPLAQTDIRVRRALEGMALMGNVLAAARAEGDRIDKGSGAPSERGTSASAFLRTHAEIIAEGLALASSNVIPDMNPPERIERALAAVKAFGKVLK